MGVGGYLALILHLDWSAVARTCVDIAVRRLELVPSNESLRRN